MTLPHEPRRRMPARDSAIEHRALKNAVAGALSFAATLGQTILLVPILLSYWGPERYGLWLTLMAVFTLLQALDNGHQNFVSHELNLQYHGDVAQFRRTLSAGVRIALFVGLVELGICLLLISTGLLGRLLGIPAGFAEQQLALALLVLMGMWVVFGSVGGIVTRILIPTGMFYQLQWLGIAQRLAQLVAVAIAVYAGGGILAAAVWYAAATSFTSLLIFRYLRRTLPEFYPWWQGATWREGLMALRKSLVLTVNQVGQQLSNNGLVVLVSLLFASAVIPVFTTLRTLTNTASIVTTVFITALFPDMIRFHATRQVGKLTDVFYTNWFVSGAFVNFGIVLVLPLVEPIYGVWTKGYLEFDPLLFLLLAAAISLVNFGAGLTMYLQGINDLAPQVLMTVTRAATVFLVGVALSSVHGIVGIGIACLLAEILASVVLPLVFVNRHVAALAAPLGKKQVVLAMMPPVLLVVACVIVMTFGTQFSTITFALLPPLAVTYYATWKSLGGDVRARIASLRSSFTRKRVV